MNIWIKNGANEFGPGTEEQFLSAYRAGRLSETAIFRLDEDKTWKHISEFTPAVTLAIESTNWSWLQDGAVATTQVGPESGSVLITKRKRSVTKTTAVYNPVFTQGQWVEFGRTLLEIAYQKQLAAEIQKKEEQKNEKRLQKRQAKEARQLEKIKLAEQKAKLKIHQAKEAALAAASSNGGFENSSLQQQTMNITSVSNSNQNNCWYCTLPTEGLIDTCVYCGML